MRGLAQPDLQDASAQEVIRYAVERFHPRLTMACSFQKEESVLVHMVTEIEPDVRIFTIDTGVLFPETLATWHAFEGRFGVKIESLDASSPGEPWTVERCCGAAKVEALERGLADADAWITGIRREQAPTRATTPKVEHDERGGLWKFNPIADWTEKDVWRYIFDHDLPYHPLHDQGYSSIGCAPCTQPGTGREGRWTGQDKTECGIHVVPPSAS
ncbi:MAG TPA: phosphoadenylyl-sulfate reductase [Solirubrobacteraceae bacterium]|nr:phosphoadenylyl-sulfate reductase [Solirubrobacteraceae bacterium]